MLVAVSVIVVIPLGEIQSFEGETGILIEVVKQGAPNFPVSKVFPFLTVFAVANTALINMLMASRLIYGLARQDVLPRALGKVSVNRRAPWAGIAFTTVLALGLITVVTLDSDSSVVVALSGTTALLLLVVFTIVNIACLVARRRSTTTPSFRAPTVVPIIGAISCAFLVGPWARDPGASAPRRPASGTSTRSAAERHVESITWAGAGASGGRAGPRSRPPRSPAPG